MGTETLTTLALAEELANLEFNQLSNDDIEQIQRLILDYSAVTLLQQ